MKRIFDDSDTLLAELGSRLPELEWRMSQLNFDFSGYSLPKGLFRAGLDSGGKACINEIKADITSLIQQKNPRSAVYLAGRVQQKINVLVTLCQLQSRKEKPQDKIPFTVTALSTRQQWISSLETEILNLQNQHQALAKTLGQRSRDEDAAAMLRLKAELGEIERRLTLAKETLNKAVL